MHRPQIGVLIFVHGEAEIVRVEGRARQAGKHAVLVKFPDHGARHLPEPAVPVYLVRTLLIRQGCKRLGHAQPLPFRPVPDGELCAGPVVDLKTRAIAAVRRAFPRRLIAAADTVPAGRTEVAGSAGLARDASRHGLQSLAARSRVEGELALPDTGCRFVAGQHPGGRCEQKQQQGQVCDGFHFVRLSRENSSPGE